MTKGIVPIASAKRGSVLVQGRATAEGEIRAPISGKSCIAWRITALTLSMYPKLLFDRANWAEGFQIYDPSGSLLVDVGGFSLDFSSRWAIEITGQPKVEEIPSAWLELCEEEGISPWPEEPWLGRTLIVEGTLSKHSEILIRGRVERLPVVGTHPYRELRAGARLCRGQEGGEIWTRRPKELLPGLSTVTGLGLASLGTVAAGLLEVGGLLALLAALAATWVSHPEPDLLALWRTQPPSRRGSISELQNGPSTIKGRVSLVEEPIYAPLSQTPCVAYELALWQEEGLIQHLLLRTSDAVPSLFLRDTTGKILVKDPKKIQLTRPAHASLSGRAGERLPESIKPVLQQIGIPIPGDGRAPFRWYAEERILRPGEEALVTGWALIAENEKKIQNHWGVSLLLRS